MTDLRYRMQAVLPELVPGGEGRFRESIESAVRQVADRLPLNTIIHDVRDDRFWKSGDIARSIQNAIDAAPAWDPSTATGDGGVAVRVVIPPGKWQLARTIATTKSNIEIVGEGGSQGSEIGTAGSDPYGFISGPPSVEIVAPNGAGAFHFGDGASVNQFSGPLLRNFVVSSYHDTLTSPTSTYGLWFDRVNNFYCERVYTKGFIAAGAVGWKFNSGGGATMQYPTLVDCGDFNSRVGMEFKDSSGVALIAPRLFGNGGSGVTSATGTIGIHMVSNSGSLQVFGMRIQGYDTLVRIDSDVNSCFVGCRHEGWFTACYDIGATLIADRVQGTQIDGGSWGNFGASYGTVFNVSASVTGDPWIRCSNATGGATLLNDPGLIVSGFINGEFRTGGTVFNSIASGAWKAYATVLSNTGFGAPVQTASAVPASPVAVMNAYDENGTFVGYLPVYASFTP